MIAKQSQSLSRNMNSLLAAAVVSIIFTSSGNACETSCGPVTDLPLPRFASIDVTKAHARRGPSLRYRIDWVYRREGLPVIITAEYGHWRRVVDNDGLGGWMHYALLSGERTALIISTIAPMRVSPYGEAPEVAILEQDVVGQIERCSRNWCRLETNGYEGWVSKEHLWGVGIDINTE